MSRSDPGARTFSDLATEISARCLEAVESGRFDDVPSDALGQVFASAVQLFAAKAQAGESVLPFGRNSGVTTTDVAIGCTAMLDAVNLALFELGAWQAMSSVGRIRHEEPELERF
ncbi:MAG: hypothetical protein JSR61_07400 [Proteobacteria bacterium]|nr:hypothetical protein [Pseudomonadota bacterium]